MTDDWPRSRDPWAPRSWEDSGGGHLESLPETAGQIVPEHRPGPTHRRNGPARETSYASPGGPPRAAWLIGVFAAASCFVLALAYFLLVRDGSDVSTVASESSEGSESTGETPVTGVTVAQSAAPSDSSTSSQAAAAPPGAGLSGTIDGGTILVAGEVPTTQASAALVLLLEQVVGVGNVDTSGLSVNPDAADPDRITLIVANEVVFAPSSDQIESRFLSTLDNVVKVMTASPDLTAVVEGHADAVGAQSVNLSLSQRRADAVVDYLADNGIERVRLVGIGRGSDEPIADNSTPEGRARNRRIEFVIVGFRLDL